MGWAVFKMVLQRPRSTGLQNKSERKMSVVVPQHLARGPAARPRCIPPASGSFWELNPIQSHRSYRRSTTRGRLRSPCTHRSFQEDHGAIAPLGTTRRAWRRASPPAPNHAQTSGRPITNQGAFLLPPIPHDHFMETNLPQFGCAPCHGDDFIETRKGAFHSCPCLGTIPSMRVGSCRTGSLTNPTLCHLSLKFELSLLPIRHHAAQEIKEFAPMVRMLDMAKLVCDHIVNRFR